MPKIHPMAVVEKGAVLADDVEVGPFAYVGPHVALGAGCIVHHHAQIEGHTTAGEQNEFFPNCVIGCVSQDLKYRGGNCPLIIGSRNKFRENCTVHIGTEDGGGQTRIGDNNLLMVASHIAHDCIIGSNCILANNVMLAGHVVVDDWVVISGGAASHHFVTFGKHSFVGGLSAVTRDVPPFMVVEGHPCAVRGVNRTGLKRRGYSDAQLDVLKVAYRMLFSDTTPLITQAVELERMYPDQQEIQMLLAFMRASINGKYGRARESLRGRLPKAEEDDEHPHATGN
ncbi:MAG TPA: acyl-ACP--UDP-N-acetylglucosamine O-acyltransferase [Phycisphaerae bacterium]|jgi:UDP-N-acetylglucosamine acyltransferase|nr:acyl-ACP--UDP-N-acetylglucosamine O-acyltransferase [Phycisphaerae bacterium]